MSGISHYGANVFAGVMSGVYSIPATFYLGVTTSPVGPDHSANQMTEPVDTSYARQQISMSSTFWSTPVSGITHNIAPVTFPVATEQWGPLNHWVITNSLTGGAIIMWSDFTQGIVVDIGNALTIPAGTLSISVVVPETMF